MTGEVRPQSTKITLIIIHARQRRVGLQQIAFIVAKVAASISVQQAPAGRELRGRRWIDALQIQNDA
ncbi:hypothetical protein XH98_04130 [Bradyrhizobium sp. CCBAU 51745]|nr:hypothetical protein [Bradyrhizobium sp. CCBAU 51745]